MIEKMEKHRTAAEKNLKSASSISPLSIEPLAKANVHATLALFYQREAENL